MISRTILVVVQDDHLRQTVVEKLQKEKYTIHGLQACSDALEHVMRTPPALILLDSRHLHTELLQFCRQLRTLPGIPLIPILMLVYSEVEITRLVYSDVYINDYILMPPLWEELQACVHTLLRSGKRRSNNKVMHKPYPRQKAVFAQEQVLEVDDLRIDVEHSCVMRKSQPIHLRQPLLFDLLLYLVLHRGKVLTRDQLLKHVWGYEPEYGSRTVDVHMRWLRQSLEEDPAHPQLIQTVRGVGYCFKAD